MFSGLCREAVEAGRKVHGTDKKSSWLEVLEMPWEKIWCSSWRDIACDSRAHLSKNDSINLLFLVFLACMNFVQQLHTLFLVMSSMQFCPRWGLLLQGFAVHREWLTRLWSLSCGSNVFRLGLPTDRKKKWFQINSIFVLLQQTMIRRECSSTFIHECSTRKLGSPSDDISLFIQLHFRPQSITLQKTWLNSAIVSYGSFWVRLFRKRWMIWKYFF